MSLVWNGINGGAQSSHRTSDSATIGSHQESTSSNNTRFNDQIDTMGYLMASNDSMTENHVQNHGFNMDFSDDQDDNSSAEVHLSICWSCGKLGAAYYDTNTCEINVMNDTVDVAPEFVILNKVIRVCKPTVIVSGLHQDERFIAMLREIETRQQEDVSSDTVTDINGKCLSTGFNLNLEATIDFDIGAARTRIVNLNLPGMPKALTDHDRLIFISSLINFDSISMIRALGALLKHLDRKRINVQLEDYTVKSPIVNITTFSVKGLLSLDDDTYKGLQIFQKEWHPSVYKMASGMKEGLSLFGILNQCKSSIGSKEMQLWFMRPTRESNVLIQRQMAIAFGVDPLNSDVVISLQKQVKHVRSVVKILGAMNVGQCTVIEWQTLYKSIYSAARIGEICRNLPQTIDIFRTISNAFNRELLNIASVISSTVDFEESVLQNKFVVKFGVDKELDQKKRNYNGLPDFMTTIAREELIDLDETVAECKVIYLPQLGYMLAIDMSPEMIQTKNYFRAGLEFVFASQMVVYYKSRRTKELDVILGDIQTNINDQEIQIMIELQNMILEHAALLSDVTKYSAQLDCLMSMASVAKEFNYVRPKMTDEDVIVIEKGRHPLQELCVTTFVPNSTESGLELGSKIKLLTGPNACGKSIYLKQVGLIVFMAHIGSFVPAVSASIGHVDAIFTRIHTLESVSVGLSTFMVDLNQVSLAMRLATKHSLVIIDEFGKGTSAVDGMALLAACLEDWASQSLTCPHLFVATHIYGVLKLLQHRIGQTITCQTLETSREKDELAYLYQLVDGQASCSYARWVALQANIPRRVVDRGLQITRAVCGSKSIPHNQQYYYATQKTFSKYEKMVDYFVSVELTNNEEVINSFLDELRKLATNDDDNDECQFINNSSANLVSDQFKTTDDR